MPDAITIDGLPDRLEVFPLAFGRYPQPVLDLFEPERPDDTCREQAQRSLAEAVGRRDRARLVPFGAVVPLVLSRGTDWEDGHATYRALVMQVSTRTVVVALEGPHEQRDSGAPGRPAAEAATIIAKVESPLSGTALIRRALEGARGRRRRRRLWIPRRRSEEVSENATAVVIAAIARCLTESLFRDELWHLRFEKLVELEGSVARSILPTRPAVHEGGHPAPEGDPHDQGGARPGGEQVEAREGWSRRIASWFRLWGGSREAVTSAVEHEQGLHDALRAARDLPRTVHSLRADVAHAEAVARRADLGRFSFWRFGPRWRSWDVQDAGRAQAHRQRPRDDAPESRYPEAMQQLHAANRHLAIGIDLIGDIRTSLRDVLELSQANLAVTSGEVADLANDRSRESTQATAVLTAAIAGPSLVAAVLALTEYEASVPGVLVAVGLVAVSLIAVLVAVHRILALVQRGRSDREAPAVGWRSKLALIGAVLARPVLRYGPLVAVIAVLVALSLVLSQTVRRQAEVPPQEPQAREQTARELAALRREVRRLWSLVEQASSSRSPPASP